MDRLNLHQLRSVLQRQVPGLTPRDTGRESGKASPVIGLHSQVSDPNTQFLEYKLHMDKDHVGLTASVSLYLKVGRRVSTNIV